jgi:hypothetical protein
MREMGTYISIIISAHAERGVIEVPTVDCDSTTML